MLGSKPRRPGTQHRSALKKEHSMNKTATLETVAVELRAIREFMATIADRRLDRKELAARWGVSPSTLDRRVKTGSAPQPTNGRWPLSEIIEWEMSQKGSKL